MSNTIHHHQRATIADMINPRSEKRTKDYMKENRINLRESEARGRESREIARQPEKELYKLAQFRDVSSRIYDPAPESQQNNNRPALDGEFLTRGIAEKRREDLAQEGRMKRAELDRKMEDARQIAERPITPRKNAVPKAMETSKLAERTNADFINRNKIKAVTMIPHQTMDKNPSSKKHENYGRVPEYIEQRKAQWEEEKEAIRRRAPDPNCPKGMTLMPEEERLETLEVLKTSKIEALKQLQSLPFVIETPSQKKRQQILEDKLREIENAIGLFSKAKVYIAL